MEFNNIQEVNKFLLDIINKKIKEVLNIIATDYNLDYKELIIKYLKTPETNTILEVPTNIEIVKKTLNDTLRCKAETRSNTRCKRSCKNNSQFCNIHYKKNNIILD
tara:strand:- start:286 stop:603 length:318 start_codon:yes stop_codon:yes gene_type:complete